MIHSAITWSGLPIRSNGPLLCARMDNVTDRILNIVIGFHIRFRMILNDRLFYLTVRLGNGWKGTQVISKQNSITLICTPRQTHMHIDASADRGWLEEPLLPFVSICIFSRWY